MNIGISFIIIRVLLELELYAFSRNNANIETISTDPKIDIFLFRKSPLYINTKQ